MNHPKVENGAKNRKMKPYRTLNEEFDLDEIDAKRRKRYQEENLEWFGLLVSSVQNHSFFVPSTRKNASTKPPKNKTLILASWAPIPLINEMNTLKNDNITISAAKAMDNVAKHTNFFFDDMSFHTRRYMAQPRTFDIICMIGPIVGKELTEKIITQWEQNSRGPQPRTIAAYALAKEYNLNFTVNMPLFLQIDPKEAGIDVTKNDWEEGMTLKITPLLRRLRPGTAMLKKINEDKEKMKLKRLKAHHDRRMYRKK